MANAVAWAVRKDSKSQGGFIVGLAERQILAGEQSPVSPLLLCTKKCPRVARSSLSCEVQSGNMANEEQEFVRLAYLDLCIGEAGVLNAFLVFEFGGSRPPKQII